MTKYADSVVHTGTDSGYPLVTVRDLAFLALFPAILLAAWFAPPGMQQAIARGGAHLRAWIKPGAEKRDSTTLSAPFSALPDPAIARDMRAHFYLEMLTTLNLSGPWERLPATRLNGRDNIDAALAAGKGAVLWVVPTAYAPVMSKLALARAGLRVSHLSRPHHGFSRSRLGQAVINRKQIHAEEQFLDARVVIENGNVRPALAELARRLGENRLVSITVGVEASRLLTVPFLNGRMTVSPRPVDFARRAGAPLLPVVTLRNGDGSFTVEAGASLIAPDDPEGEAGALRAIGRLAAFVEPRAAREPAQFARSRVFSA